MAGGACFSLGHGLNRQNDLIFAVAGGADLSLGRGLNGQNDLIFAMAGGAYLSLGRGLNGQNAQEVISLFAFRYTIWK